MKKVLIGLLLFSLSFGVVIDYPSAPGIRSSFGKVRKGYQSLHLESISSPIVSPSTTLTFYADNIGGYGTISLYGLDTATGNATTISAQAVYANGIAVSGCAVQVITSGTPTATIKSPFYKFVYNTNKKVLVNTTNNYTNIVTFNLLIND